ncbi:MAG: error-prone DNA polymerase [Alphaproteobacteria bacterium]
MTYTELQVTTNFSFLNGGSHPDELVLTAAALGHEAIAVTDRNTLAGVVRAHAAAKKAGLRLVVGARLDLGLDKHAAEPSLSVLCYPTDRAAYGRLSQLLTVGRRRAPKGQCWLRLDDVLQHDEGQVFVVLPPVDDGTLRRLAERWAGRCYLAASFLYRGDDRRRIAELAAQADRTGAALLATNDVLYHVPSRRPLQDVLACIRAHCTVDTAGWRLAANAERHLKPPVEMARLFADHAPAVARTGEIVARCTFSLDELRYEYPAEPVPDGMTPQQELEQQTWQGAHGRYDGDIPEAVRATLRHELSLIGELDYAPYFLTVADIVRFARSKNILCQGRGSAANSAVCYCLGITAVDPAKLDLLFERFVSAERNEPPDIDVDFEHERREEVLQYVYAKYGRDRAGLAATVISYRAKSAIREVGKAMGLSADVVGALADNIWGWGSEDVDAAKVREIGLDPDDRRLGQALELARALIGFPRHLSQHVGGFVITRGPLSQVVPIENAAMDDRTVIEWDKDDLDTLRILKIDLLALGMLTCIAKGFDLLRAHHDLDLDLAGVPAEDAPTYDMLCRADSLGVFQVESRAQMTMLPRLRPRDFYDLVIEVAIVRPGPIQGDMVHPYLRRRAGKEAVSFPSKALEQVLGKTLGIPLFQEQAMKIAIVAAGFTPSEADQLRRAMATFRRTGTIGDFHAKMVDGMVMRGYERDFAERCFKQIEGFGEYGFPESHAASFALLVYVSAWMKCHYPAVFAAALLNSQPMGFYAPAQIVRDAREHGVEARPVDVNLSDWDNTLEPVGGQGPDAVVALRLGFRQMKGLREDEMRRLVALRGDGYADPRALWERVGLRPATLQKLAHADAWRSCGLDRRQALWAIRGLGEPPLPLFAAAEARAASPDAAVEPAVTLPAMALGEHVVQDYEALRLSLKAHPMELLRDHFPRAVQASRLMALRQGTRVEVAGLVLVRQRPGTAKGVIFVTLEDETGVANLIVRSPIFERFRRVVLASRLIAVRGRVEREGIVIHVMADEITDRSTALAILTAQENMPAVLARADEVKRLGRDPREVLPKGRSFR